MRIDFFVIILSLLLSYACKEINKEKVMPENFVAKTVWLHDLYQDTSFCKVNLWVPAEFDTLLQWVDWSDCTCCDEKKYRFTNSDGCLIKESGFFKTSFCKDSFYRLTISNQCAGEDLFTMDTILLNKIYERKNNDVLLNPQWKNKEIKYINERPYIILHYFGQDYYAGKPFEQIIAITQFNKTSISFRWECCQPECPDFSKKAYQTLESIKIEGK